MTPDGDRDVSWLEIVRMLEVVVGVLVALLGVFFTALTDEDDEVADAPWLALEDIEIVDREHHRHRDW